MKFLSEEKKSKWDYYKGFSTVKLAQTNTSKRQLLDQDHKS